jgi:hypothetical protein
VYLILLLQTAATVVTLPIGILAMVIGRRSVGARVHRQAWLLVGWIFLVLGAFGSLQAALSIWAASAGPGTAIWTHYLLWAPGMNYARGLVTTAFAVALFLLARPGGEPRLGAYLPFGLGVTVALGLVVGHMEGPLGETNHVARQAVLTAVTVIILLAALLLAAATDAVDRLLWLAVTIFTIKQALSVSLLSILAWMAFDAAIRPLTFFAMHATALGLVLLLVLRRYQLARQHREVPALFGPVSAVRKHRVLT